MKTRYHYEIGAVRWRKHDYSGDVRGYRPVAGWEAEAMMLDRHPITGVPFKEAQWWFREEYTGED